MIRILKSIGPKKTYALLNKLILTFSGILTVFVIIRALPQYEFGLYTLFNTFDLIIFAVSGGVILQALEKYAAEVTDKELNDLTTNSIVLYTVLSLVPASFIALFSKYFVHFLNAEPLSGLLKLLPLVVLSHLGRKLAYSILLAKEKLKEIFVIDFISFLISAGLILAFYFTNNLNKAVTVIKIRVTANFIAGIVSIFYLRKIIELNLRLDKYWVSRLLDFGKYSFGTTIGNIIHTRIDTLMIAYFYNPLTLAMYNSAKGIADFFRNFVQAANMIVLPRASNLFSKSDLKGVRTIYYKGISYSLILVLPIALTMILIPNLILYVAYNAKYQDSANILRILALCSLISPFGTIGSSIAGGIGKPNFAFIAMFFAVIMNVCLNLILIPKFGAIGAAYATLIAMIVGGITITVLIHQMINLSITGDNKSFFNELALLLKNKK